MLRPFFHLAVAASLTAVAAADTQHQLKLSLDPLLEIPGSFSMSQDDLEKTFPAPEGWKENLHFKWLTKNRDRAVFMKHPYGNVTINFSLFGGEVPCEEVTVDFVDSKINGISVSIYNRADSEGVDSEEFERRFRATGQKIGALIPARPIARKPDSRQGLLTEGWSWTTRESMAVLERNPEAAQGKLEFLRLRLAPGGAAGPIANSMRSGNNSTVRRSSLPANVVRKGSDVWIKDLPMVDQGPKGYCVVASAQRLFEYYGVPCDQHQIAEVAESDTGAGTSSAVIMQVLGKLDYRFKTRFDVLGAQYTDGNLYAVKVRSSGAFDPGSQLELKDFEKEIVRQVDAGVPLLWSLELGRYPEEPPIAQQAGGGHMRMIIGYNLDEEKLIFTDSWGAGHEFKKMKIADAFKATTGLYTVTPTIN